MRLLTDPVHALIAILVILEIKHFICDYPLQTLYQLRNKGTYLHPGGIIHSGIHALFTTAAFLVVAPGWGLGIAIVVTDHTATGDAPDVAGRVLTPPDADLTAVAVTGAVQERTPRTTWYVALGVAWASFVATALLLPPLLVWRRRAVQRR